MLYLDSGSHIVLTRERFNERDSWSHGGVTGGFDCREGEGVRETPSLRNGRIIRDPLEAPISAVGVPTALSCEISIIQLFIFHPTIKCLPHAGASKLNNERDFGS